MKTNVIDFAAARAANKLANDDLGESLRELARRVDGGDVRNVFLAWTMKDGTVGFGHASLISAGETLEDDNLRLLGLLRIAERGFLDGLTIEGA